MSLGQTLRAAREEAGMSIEDVSRATRIRGQLIREIEDDRFEACGGAVYARGHIRAIATSLHVDPAEMLAEFDAQTGGVAGPAPREIFEHEVLAIPDRKGPNWTAAMAVAAAVALVVALVAVLNPSGPNANVASPDAGFGTPSTSASPAASAPPVTAPSVAPSNLVAGQIDPTKVFLRIAIVGDKSWVVVRDGGQNGRPIFQGTLLNGATKDFRADKELYVVLGNAGAVNLVVNGRDLGQPGQLGQVLRTSFFPGDPAAG